MTQEKSSIWLIVGAIVIAALIIGGAIIYNQKSQKGKDGASQEVSFDIKETDHIRGNFSAPVTIVEFSDFQCPYCANFHPTMKQVLENYPDKVRWVYKHYPLPFHQNAQPAAEASECAAEQGKFWEFSDGLFENQERLGKELYQELAQNLNLNMEQFQDCFASGKYKDKVLADYIEGQKVGVKGTPASFVQGKLISGAVPFASLKQTIESALNF